MKWQTEYETRNLLVPLKPLYKIQQRLYIDPIDITSVTSGLFMPIGS